MKKTMAKSTPRKTRIALVAGIAAAVCSLGVAETALATDATDSDSTRHTSAQHVTGTSDATMGRQATGGKFYAEYVSAWKQGDLKKAEHLRDTRLTKHCAKEAKAWGEKHNGDGVLRARSLPKSVKARYITFVRPEGTLVSQTEIFLKYGKKHGKKTRKLALTFDDNPRHTKISRIQRIDL